MSNVISVNLPKKLAADLYKMAKNTGKTKSELIKDALRVFLWEEKFKKIKRTVSLKAKAKKLITDDDVFKTIS
jgi:metal-responsive CopG/Arc/MetJ family transcriptional regulator